MKQRVTTGPKGIALIITLALLVGCAGMDFTLDNTHAMLVILEITSSEVACEVARIPDTEVSSVVDRSLRNFFTLARDGELSDDAIKQLNDSLSHYTLDRPTLVPNILRLMSLIDVDFNNEETALDELRVIAPDYFDAIAIGYVSGFNQCALQRY